MCVKYFDNPDIIEVTPADLEELKQAAVDAPLRRARLCLHRDHHDPVHEMVISFCRDSYVPPHSHAGKSESFHVIEGELLVVIFDNAGDVTRRIEMSPCPNGQTFFYRLNSELWHTVVPLTEFVIIHETTAGPFVREKQDLAPWAPRENDVAGIRSFVERITLGS